ncbi:MAG: hypothetical protein O9252_00965, partial [Algoriphagus sp.]|nr:hypothetical protein [Algoriphagus sp.]
MRPLFLISLLGLLVFFQINGEKIPVNDGAYGDGVFYRGVGQTFLENIEQQGYNLVQLTRILPFALLNLSFSAFHIVKDMDGMRNGMIIWQLVFLALSVYWYFRVCKKIRAKTALMTLGFVMLFFNFTWLKDFWYHPFSPDGLAFALGMGQTNYFLRYEKFKLGMLSVLGAFVSPLLVLSGLLMLFLPGDKLLTYPGQRPTSAIPLLLGMGIPLVLAVLGWVIWNWSDQELTNQILHCLSLISLVPMSVFIAKRNSIDWEASIQMLRKRVKSEKLNKGIMALAGLFLILILLSGNNDTLGVGQLVRDMGVASFRFPLDFIQGIALQWGLAMILTVLYLHRFVEELGKQGWAAVFILWTAMLILPFFSNLTLAAWIPLWVIILLKGLKRYHWGDKDMIFIGFLAFLLSLVWLPIHSPELEAWLENGGEASIVIQKWAIHSVPHRSFVAFVLSLVGSIGIGG